MADIRLMLWRLRPSSQYHWGGGEPDDYSKIIAWRDPATIQPTEQEINDEWDVYLAEQAAIEEFEAEKTQAEIDAVAAYPGLPDWLKTWTADQAAQYVHENVLNGLDAAGVDAYVDALPNTVAGMKTGLKQIGGALVAIRDILEIIAKLILYIRDLVIRFR